MCFYLLKALTEREHKHPKNIALVGTDDLFTCELMRPSLTPFASMMWMSLATGG